MKKKKVKRKFLNLGHTFGHAIEYEHKIPHGHAVMIGILYQFIVANHLFETNYNIQHYINYMKNLNIHYLSSNNFILKILTIYASR